MSEAALAQVAARELAAEIQRLRARVAELERERDQAWSIARKILAEGEERLGKPIVSHHVIDAHPELQEEESPSSP